MALLGHLKEAVTAGRAVVAALTVSLGGAAFIIGYEGTENKVYFDAVGIATVCTGHTSTVTAKDVGRVYSDSVCAELLRSDLGTSERAVKRLVKVPVTQSQYDALVSFVFNVGEGNFAKSTLLRRFNSGQCMAAAQEFKRWIYAGGKKLRGLVKRRAAESEMFASGCKE